MAGNKSISDIRLMRTGLVGPRRIAVLAILVGASGLPLATHESTCDASPVAEAAVAQPQIDQAFDDPALELVRAREKANSTQKDYQVIKQLSEKGSASLRDLRLANLRRRIALLDYSSLLDPTRYEKNRLLKAEVVFRYRNRELAVARELYQHGSVSKVMYLRAIAARDIAESNLKAIQSATETQRKFQLIQAARSRLNVAEQEFAIAKRLFASNSISLQAMDRATSNLKIATAELESSKESLGARAIQVRQ